MHGFALDPDLDDSPAKPPPPKPQAEENREAAQPSKRRRLSAEGDAAPAAGVPLSTRNGGGRKHGGTPGEAVPPPQAPQPPPAAAPGGSTVTLAAGMADGRVGVPSQEAVPPAGADASPDTTAAGSVDLRASMPPPAEALPVGALAALLGSGGGLGLQPSVGDNIPGSGSCLVPAEDSNDAGPLKHFVPLYTAESCTGSQHEWAAGAAPAAAAAGAAAPAAPGGAKDACGNAAGKAYKQAMLPFGKPPIAPPAPAAGGEGGGKAAGQAGAPGGKQRRQLTLFGKPVPPAAGAPAAGAAAAHPGQAHEQQVAGEPAGQPGDSDSAPSSDDASDDDFRPRRGRGRGAARGRARGRGRKTAQQAEPPPDAGEPSAGGGRRGRGRTRGRGRAGRAAAAAADAEPAAGPVGAAAGADAAAEPAAQQQQQQQAPAAPPAPKVEREAAAAQFSQLFGGAKRKQAEAGVETAQDEPAGGRGGRGRGRGKAAKQGSADAAAAGSPPPAEQPAAGRGRGRAAAAAANQQAAQPATSGDVELLEEVEAAGAGGSAAQAPAAQAAEAPIDLTVSPAKQAGTAAPVPEFFMTSRQKRQKREQEAAAAAAAQEARQREREAAVAAGPAKPLHPYFAAPGAGPKPRAGEGQGGVGGAWAATKKLQPPLAPIHVAQQEPAPQLAEGAGVAGGAAPPLIPVEPPPPAQAAGSQGHGAWLADSCSLLAATDADCRLWCAPPAASASAAQALAPHAGGAQAGAAAAGQLPPLLQQLAQHLHAQQAAAHGQDAEMVDLPAMAELEQQLQQELAALRQLAASNAAAGPRRFVVAGTPDAGPPDSQATSQLQASPASSLWAVKYAPAAAGQLCGNAAAGAAISQFLSDWKDRIGSAAAGQLPGGGSRGPAAGTDSDDDWLREPGYSDDSWAAEGRGSDGASGPFKALALCGPPGCGKTAAAYAVAQELGYRALEINPSADRTGVQVWKLVGEATQSKRLALSQLASDQAAGGGGGSGKQGAVAARKGGRAAGKGAAAGKAAVEIKRPAKRHAGRTICISSSDEEEDAAPAAQAGRGAAGKAKQSAAAAAAAMFGGGKRAAAAPPPPPSSPPRGHVSGDSDSEAFMSPPRGKRSARTRVPRKGVVSPVQEPPPAAPAAGGGAPPGSAPSQPAQHPLTMILFDEADNLLEADRGFAAAIAALLVDTKRPFIMTLDSAEPPPGLCNVQQVFMQPPSHAELLKLLALVCAAEGCAVPLQQLSSIVDAQRHDIRACLSAAQLWCMPSEYAAAVQASRRQEQLAGAAPWCWPERQAQLEHALCAMHGGVGGCAAGAEQQPERPDPAHEQRMREAAAARQAQLADHHWLRRHQLEEALEEWWLARAEQLALARKQSRGSLEPLAASGDWDADSATPGTSPGPQWDTDEPDTSAGAPSTSKPRGTKRAGPGAAQRARAMLAAARAAGRAAREQQAAAAGSLLCLQLSMRGRRLAVQIVPVDPTPPSAPDAAGADEEAVGAEEQAGGAPADADAAAPAPPGHEGGVPEAPDEQPAAGELDAGTATPQPAGDGSAAGTPLRQGRASALTPPVPGATPAARAAAAMRALTPPPLVLAAPPELPALQPRSAEAAAVPAAECGGDAPFGSQVSVAASQHAPHAPAAPAAGSDAVLQQLLAAGCLADRLSDADLLACPRDQAVPAAGPLSSRHQCARAGALPAHVGTNLQLMAYPGWGEWQLQLLQLVADEASGRAGGSGGGSAARFAGLFGAGGGGSSGGGAAVGAPGGCLLRWLQAPASAWLAHLTLRTDDGSCLASALEALDDGMATHGAPHRLLPTTELTPAQQAAEVLAAALAGRRPSPSGVVPEAACNTWQREGPQLLELHHAAQALVLAAPKAVAQGGAGAHERLAALRGMAFAEARRRQLEQQRLVGRVRRVPTFEHYLSRRTPALGEQPQLVAALAAAGAQLRVSDA